MASIAKREEQAAKKERDAKIGRAAVDRDKAASAFVINAKGFVKGAVDRATLDASLEAFDEARENHAAALEGGA